MEMNNQNTESTGVSTSLSVGYENGPERQGTTDCFI